MERTFGFAIILILSLFMTGPVYSQEEYSSHNYLTEQEIQRVIAVKQILYGVDTKTVQETIKELEKTRYPQINLQISEAMAKTYADLVRDYGISGQKKKEWLYSMVCLNMAFIQFGGGQGDSRGTSSLNRLICQKLKENLPLNALKQHGMIYSLGN